MEAYMRKAYKVMDQVAKAILGKEDEVHEMMTAILANGHILLEDIPGVGKTTMALAFSKALNLDFKRMQFTPDVMPSDLTGFSIYRREEERFVYQPGSVFCNLLLADEINRTSPKTQSALLEVMEERKVSVEGVTRKVPSPFMVIATQNPFGAAGTQMLPDSQLDRFMITMSLGYPDFESELTMAKEVGDSGRVDAVQTVLEGSELLEMQASVRDIYIKDVVYDYLLKLITATRNHPYIERGASPRATIALVKMAKAEAWLDERVFVTPNDVAHQFPYVVGHRIELNMAAKMENKNKKQIIDEILASVEKPITGVKRR